MVEVYLQLGILGLGVVLVANSPVVLVVLLVGRLVGKAAGPAEARWHMDAEGQS